MTKKEYSRALIPDKPPDEPSLDECAPFFLAKELDYLPLDAMGPVVLTLITTTLSASAPSSSF